MRLLSGAAPAAPQQAAAASGAGDGVPPELTRDKLREIMTFNAVTLEKELKPIRKQIEEIRKKQPEAQINPQVLASLQKRISEQVETRYGVNDAQVMAAVEEFGAREDPAFKDILTRIANTFTEALQ